MTLYSFLFYFLSALIVASTVVAITRRNLVHAVVTLIMSFFGTAMLFYLLGAPLLAALWVIIYAGAIMVLFLFIVMMTRADSTEQRRFPTSQWIPTALLGVMFLAAGVLTIFASPGAQIPLETAVATPKDFALYVFERHWLSIEIVSLLLLVALIGALHLGRRTSQSGEER